MSLPGPAETLNKVEASLDRVEALISKLEELASTVESKPVTAGLNAEEEALQKLLIGNDIPLSGVFENLSPEEYSRFCVALTYSLISCSFGES